VEEDKELDLLSGLDGEDRALSMLALGKKHLPKISSGPPFPDIADEQVENIKSGKTKDRKITQPQTEISNEAQKEKANVYPNLASFVSFFICKMYAADTTAGGKKVWLPDWYNYPAAVDRLYNLWTSWEKTHKEGSTAGWYVNIGRPIMAELMDKGTGIMHHFKGNRTVKEAKQGEILPFEKPKHNYLKSTALAITPSKGDV
jgi:hypothetical protein